MIPRPARGAIISHSSFCRAMKDGANTKTSSEAQSTPALRNTDRTKIPHNLPSRPSRGQGHSPDPLPSLARSIIHAQLLPVAPSSPESRLPRSLPCLLLRLLLRLLIATFPSSSFAYSRTCFVFCANPDHRTAGDVVRHGALEEPLPSFLPFSLNSLLRVLFWAMMIGLSPSCGGGLDFGLNRSSAAAPLLHSTSSFLFPFCAAAALIRSNSLPSSFTLDVGPTLTDARYTQQAGPKRAGTVSRVARCANHVRTT